MEFDGVQAELTKQVIGIAFEVSNELGSGFLESVYKKAMVIALRQAGLHVVEEMPIAVSFRGLAVGNFYADLVVNVDFPEPLRPVNQTTSPFLMLTGSSDHASKPILNEINKQR